MSKIIKFTEDTDIEGRLYLAGQSHEFDDAVANQAFKDGVAYDPEKETTDKPTGNAHETTAAPAPKKKAGKSGKV